jgi:uncharacterized protein (TIGR03000 family)
MPRIVLLVCLIGLSAAARPALGQSSRQTVILEILLPDEARLFIEGEETKETGSMRIFESPPLEAGKYTYTLKTIVPGPKGPKTITRRIDVRPGDFESIDLRPRREGERVPDVLYEPAPQKAVKALLDLARIKADDVLWDLGCGDGRIPVTAARNFGIKARGFEIDPKCLEEARANVDKNGVGKLVAIEDRDIFALDLSREPTIVTLYLLPSLNARLLPQLQKLPSGARVISVGHRMADIPPDQQVKVDTEDGEYVLYLWRVETLRALSGDAATKESELEAGAAGVAGADNPWISSTRRCGGRLQRR